MAVPTVIVTCQSIGAQNPAHSGATYTATLDQAEVFSGESVQTTVTAIADGSGVALLALWPNVLGTKNSVYRIIATRSGTGEIFRSVTVRVPQTNCFLDEILVNIPVLPAPALSQVLSDTQVALISINTSKTQAQDSANSALDSKNNSKISETNSEAFKESARIYSESALNNKNISATNAQTAINQALIATTKAQEAAAIGALYADLQESFMAQATSIMQTQVVILKYAKYK